MTALDNLRKSLILKYLAAALFFLVVLGITHDAGAQSLCTNSLRRAERAYDEGNLQLIPEMLKDCLRNGFKKDEKVQALRILTLAYLYLDRKFEADVAMYDLLSAEPLYQLQENDPVEFQELYETYITDPIFSVGISAGTNFSVLEADHQFATYQLSESTPIYHSKFGFQIATRFSRYLLPRLELNVTSGIKNRKFEYENDMFNFAKVVYTESQWLVEFPVYIRYDILKGNIRPYVSVGVNSALLLSATGNLLRDYSDNSNPGISSADVSVKKYRHTLHLSYAAGLGFKYQIRKGYLILELKHNFSRTNMVRNDVRFDNSEFLYKYYYMDNDFRFSDAEISFGYTQSFYKPRKRKMYRTENQ